MRYKRGINVIADAGNIVTFNAEERSKLLLTYVCKFCNYKTHIDLISALPAFKDPGFYKWICGKCIESTFFNQEFLKCAQDKVNDLTRKDLIIVNKLKQVYPKHPFFK